MSHTYEIEIKSLLGSEENAENLRKQLSKRSDIKEVGKHSQLNHYFNAPDEVASLEESLLPIVPESKHEKLRLILEEGENHSVRTRDADGTVLIVIKASIDDDTSANGVSRIEFEEEVDMSIEELDALLLDAGLTYQAKWSRDREEYESPEMNITIDRNAGYGYLAEFEKVLDSDEEVEKAKGEIYEMMEKFGVEELPQDRLERMFEYYNENWEDYYGTGNIFNIE